VEDDPYQILRMLKLSKALYSTQPKKEEKKDDIGLFTIS
jgi:hypothetical protein